MKHKCACGGIMFKVFHLIISGKTLTLWQCTKCKFVEATE